MFCTLLIQHLLKRFDLEMHIRKWGAIMFQYDLFAAFNPEAMLDIRVDTNMVHYYADCDLYHRMRLAGYLTIELRLRSQSTLLVYDMKDAIDLDWKNYTKRRCSSLFTTNTQQNWNDTSKREQLDYHENHDQRNRNSWRDDRLPRGDWIQIKILLLSNTTFVLETKVGRIVDFEKTKAYYVAKYHSDKCPPPFEKPWIHTRVWKKHNNSSCFVCLNSCILFHISPYSKRQD